MLIQAIRVLQENIVSMCLYGPVYTTMTFLVLCPRTLCTIEYCLCCYKLRDLTILEFLIDCDELTSSQPLCKKDLHQFFLFCVVIMLRSGLFELNVCYQTKRTAKIGSTFYYTARVAAGEEGARGIWNKYFVVAGVL